MPGAFLPCFSCQDQAALGTNTVVAQGRHVSREEDASTMAAALERKDGVGCWQRRGGTAAAMLTKRGTAVLLKRPAGEHAYASMRACNQNLMPWANYTYHTP